MIYELNIDIDGIVLTTIIYSFYLLLIYTRSARIGETSIHSFIFIQILVIDLDLTSSNDQGRSTV